jgi:predicted ATP-grasp superfamily ATP-dependent carboligase
MKKVLLTYGWVRSSYAVLRNLSGRGVEVYVADSFRTGMSQWSHKKAGFDRYPSHYYDEEGFVQGVLDICRERSIDLIFPSHNETEILAQHRHRFPGSLGALLPAAEHCALFNNKARSYEFAKDAGVPVPLRLTYDQPEAVARLLREAGMERTVIKLLTGNSSKGVHYAQTVDEAQSLVLRLIAEYKLPPDRFPQIEEFVSGEGWGSSVLYWQGLKVAGFTHRRLREKLATGGTSTLRESSPHPQLEAAAERIFSRLGWHGHAMAEFKVCPQTGKFWFIEVNPRLWGSLPLAVNAGVEFPYLAWLCATDGVDAALRHQSQCTVRASWRNRWLLGDLMLAARDLVRLRPDRALRNLSGSGVDAVDDFFWDDPLVFPGEIAHYVATAISKGSLNASEEGMVR